MDVGISVDFGDSVRRRPITPDVPSRSIVYRVEMDGSIQNAIEQAFIHEKSRLYITGVTVPLLSTDPCFSSLMTAYPGETFRLTVYRKSPMVVESSVIYEYCDPGSEPVNEEAVKLEIGTDLAEIINTQQGDYLYAGKDGIVVRSPITHAIDCEPEIGLLLSQHSDINHDITILIPHGVYEEIVSVPNHVRLVAEGDVTIAGAVYLTGQSTLSGITVDNTSCGGWSPVSINKFELSSQVGFEMMDCSIIGKAYMSSNHDAFYNAAVFDKELLLDMNAGYVEDIPQYPNVSMSGNIGIIMSE